MIADSYTLWARRKGRYFFLPLKHSSSVLAPTMSCEILHIFKVTNCFVIFLHIMLRISEFSPIKFKLLPPLLLPHKLTNQCCSLQTYFILLPSKCPKWCNLIQLSKADVYLGGGFRLKIPPKLKE